MDLKQKCLYTLLGAGIMLVGTIVGSLFTPLGAQYNEIGFYREVHCNGLYISDPETGKQVAALDYKPALRMWNKHSADTSESVILHAWDGHGVLGLLDADETPRHLLKADNIEPGITYRQASYDMADKDGNMGVRLTSDHIIGGFVQVHWDGKQRIMAANKIFDPSTLIVP